MSRRPRLRARSIRDRAAAVKRGPRNSLVDAEKCAAYDPPVMGGIGRLEIVGARWAVAGDFITWDRSVKWLGLRDGHRVRYLIGANDTTGTTRSDRIERSLLDPLPAAAARLIALTRYLPFLKVSTETSSWFPITDRQVMVLYAIGQGYLAEVASESRAPA